MKKHEENDLINSVYYFLLLANVFNEVSYFGCLLGVSYQEPTEVSRPPNSSKI